MKVLYYTLAISLCFLLGYTLYEPFFIYSKSLLQPGLVPLEDRTYRDAKIGAVVLGVFCGMLPLFHLMMTSASRLNTVLKQLLGNLLVLISGILFWRLRIFGLNTELKKLNEFIFDDRIPANPVAVNQFKFDVYLFIGFLVGALIAILIFRDQSSPLIKN